MPIKIPNDLPAVKTLEQENIFVMTERRAVSQDIRPLKILLLNLMPTKIDTETQFCRLLGNTPLQVELTLLRTASYESKNISAEHLETFYKGFDDVKDENFDGMIITGAPVELLRFGDVDYWDELCGIMDWGKTHVTSTIFVCWGAQAGLYHFYGIHTETLPEKLFGVFPHTVTDRQCPLFRGFDDTFLAPHSRHTGNKRHEIEGHPALKILATSEKAGIFALEAEGGRQIFITGHPEYDAVTLEREYVRDKNLGKPIRVPENYYPNDDDTKRPLMNWRAHASLLYSNWLNYYVYQATPYDIESIH